MQKVRRRTDYYTIRYQSGSDLLAHIIKLKDIHNDLVLMGENVDDKDLAMVLLGSLPYEKFEPMITTLDISVRDTDLTFARVKEHLLNSIDRVHDGNQATGQPAGGALMASHGNNTNCHFCNKPGHWARDCRLRKFGYQSNRGGDGGRGRGGTRGYGQSRGHGRGSYGGGSQHSAQVVRSSSPVLLTAIDLSRAQTSNDVSKDWLVDSGASMHMLSDGNRMFD
jgi:hypothetical protein